MPENASVFGHEEPPRGLHPSGGLADSTREFDIRHVTTASHKTSPRQVISYGAGGVNPNDLVCSMPHCESDVADGIGILLCIRHLQKAWAAYQIHMGADVPAPRPDPEHNVRELKADGVVYIVRVGDMLKIGWTSNPKVRFSALKADAVIHQFRGTRKDEYKLQAQFLDYLVKGREWFECTPETMRMVEEFRSPRLAA